MQTDSAISILSVAEGLIEKLDNAEILSKYHQIKDRIAPTVDQSQSVPPSPVLAPSPAFLPFAASMPVPSVRATSTTSTQVMISGLRNENELLRAQLASLTAREREAQTKVTQLQAESELEMQAARHQFESFQAATVGRLNQDLDAANSKILELQQSKQQLQEQLALHSQQQLLQSGKSRQLDNSAGQALHLIQQLNAEIDTFQKEMLPTFKPPSTSVPHFPNDEFGLLTQAQIARNSVQLLKSLVEAKMETVTMIRQRLKQENLTVKNELEQLASSQRVGDSALQRKQMEFEAERSALRDEMKQLQSLYDSERQQLRSQVLQREQSIHEHLAQQQRLMEELEALQQSRIASQEDYKKLEERLHQTDAARAQLADQLRTERKTIERQSKELDSLKLTQKYLGRSTEIGQIPQEKIDLMRMVDSLVTEITKLKEEKVRTETELKQAKRLATTAQAQSTTQISQRELTMAAFDQVSDMELTAKLLRRKLGKVAE
eukprot:TRINITY_DN787_c0_g1_i2.p1 TRINITY_DN787_c0_g1~~TRINITY_DN787_c0_g1_i2.p1  ORF type:complete len:492 (-),score=133.33 TRINITY_DN787_c0_g1_i2:883-2358(-)